MCIAQFENEFNTLLFIYNKNQFLQCYLANSKNILHGIGKRIYGCGYFFLGGRILALVRIL